MTRTFPTDVTQLSISMKMYMSNLDDRAYIIEAEKFFWVILIIGSADIFRKNKLILMEPDNVMRTQVKFWIVTLLLCIDIFRLRLYLTILTDYGCLLVAKLFHYDGWNM